MIQELTIIFRLLLAGILSAVIGSERQEAKRPAGLRTYMIVCITSALMTMCGLYLFPNADQARLSSSIIIGIGFLGAGTIMSYGKHVYGLTTAAGIWATAGIGIAVGAGFYIPAIFATLLIFIILEMWKIEEKLAK